MTNRASSGRPGQSGAHASRPGDIAADGRLIALGSLPANLLPSRRASRHPRAGTGNPCAYLLFASDPYGPSAAAAHSWRLAGGGAPRRPPPHLGDGPAAVADVLLRLERELRQDG